MSDPIAQITELLEPVASFTKLVTAAGSWTVRREEVERPFYCAALDGSFHLAVPGREPVTIGEGDFLLLPLARRFETFSLDRKPGDHRETIPVSAGPGAVRVGEQTGEPDVRQIVGYGEFGSENAALVAALLPPILIVRGEPRLTALVRLIDGETRAQRPARGEVMTHLLTVVLIEALRSTGGSLPTPGLLNGLADSRLGSALRAIHADPARAWTVTLLASEAGLSRTAFFTRFQRQVGMSPMRYLLHWRMLLARRLLGDHGAAEVAARTGYSSSSTFSTAFSKYTGRSPSAYLRSVRATDAAPAAGAGTEGLV
ncbi:AraC family transcriptional regulator [Sphingomonas floccifaciens]|uniref:AraC family transcriptional regulator n=1 Tax=Sphingomonas floccifaciens TaxID=1844115 RepID=A0ABW4NCH9_9SPHN